jgi:hypothetical protein
MVLLPSLPSKQTTMLLLPTPEERALVALAKLFLRPASGDWIVNFHDSA